ncbi:hypothetical protein STEG23_005919, partial [Scotinomys teguina]
EQDYRPFFGYKMIILWFSVLIMKFSFCYVIALSTRLKQHAVQNYTSCSSS